MNTSTMNPQSSDNPRGDKARIVVIVLPSIALLALALRFYTRIVLVKSFSSGDIFAGLAWLFSVATTGCICYGLHWGIGCHVQDLSPLQQTNTAISSFATIIVYHEGLVFIKISILLQYLRVCVEPGQKLACKLMIVFVILFGAETFFTGIFNCWPIAFFWDWSIVGGKCLNKGVLYFVNAGINILQDFWVLGFPMVILWSTQFPGRQKYILMLILALGGLACVASIFRLHTIYTISVSEDPTYDLTGIATWSAIELNTGIICSSLTYLRPLVNRYFPSAIPSNNSVPSLNTVSSAISQSKTQVSSVPTGSGTSRTLGDSISLEDNYGGRSRDDAQPDFGSKPTLLHPAEV